MTFGSIRARLLAWSAGLTLLALAFAWFALSMVLADFVNRRLGAELGASARGVMAAAGWDELGTFSVTPPPADPRFEVPRSGWYWQVSDADATLARSASLLAADLVVQGGTTTGPDGAALISVVERFTAPGDSRPLSVLVTLPEAEARAELNAVRQPLMIALTVLAVSLLAAQIFAVRAGMVDLTRFARVVSDLHDGKTTTLPPPRASELQPLAAAVNRLISANAAQIDRARAHAGDLAHALKTPLAVLGNRAGQQDKQLIDRMDRMISWHLKRARASAAGLDPSAQCPVAPVLEDVALVLRPSADRRGVALAFKDQAAPNFRGDAEDLAEIIGTVAENAVKWAVSQVTISAKPSLAGLEIIIADDGPGIPEADRARLSQRGARLDEDTPGHGLGLAIVADRVASYGGSLSLGTAPLGGLLVTIVLPAHA